MLKHSDVYQIGTLSKTHGLKGEIVFQFTDDIFDTEDCDFLIVEIDGILVPFFIDEYRFRSDTTVLMKFQDIDSVEQAQPLVGCKVFAEKSIIRESDSENISLRYFIGFRINDTEGRTVGIIDDIDDNTENWLFILKNDKGREMLIPAHEELIADINQETETLTMNIPEGLLDL